MNIPTQKIPYSYLMWECVDYLCWFESVEIIAKDHMTVNPLRL